MEDHISFNTICLDQDSLHIYQNAQNVAESELTSDSILEETGWSENKKKRKINEVYYNRKCKDEDEYEVLKLCRVIWNYMFKYLTFCRGEGVRSCTKYFERMNTKSILFSNSHQRADVIQKTDYQYDIMKLLGYDDKNISLSNRNLGLKTYNEHVIDEIRQLRGRRSSRLK